MYLFDNNNCYYYNSVLRDSFLSFGVLLGPELGLSHTYYFVVSPFVIFLLFRVCLLLHLLF